MKTKRSVTIILISINVIFFGITYLYYQLLKYQLYSFSLHQWIQKVFHKNIDVYSIVYDRRAEYIIITLMYVVMFALVCKSRLINSNKSKLILSGVMGILYELQMFITDTLVNYRSFSGKYRDLSDLTLGGFAFSKVWNDSISKYGFFIIFINAAFMFSLLLLITFAKTYLTAIVYDED